MPDDAHEWVSFEDPEEHRSWVFDVTFLTSRWTCIFGAGCQGVLTGPAPELVQGCCSYGAHLVDDDDLARVEEAAGRLTPEQWQYFDKGHTKGGKLRIATRTGDGDLVTRQAEDACIFLNRPGFARGPGCALHQAALEAGGRPLDAKPTVCWQLPIRREDREDGGGHVTSTVRQWDRRHWGEGGEEFHWWCTEAAEAFVGDEPVYAALEDELVEVVGRPVYDMVVAYLTSRRGFTPHPAVRVTLGPAPARRRR